MAPPAYAPAQVVQILKSISAGGSVQEVPKDAESDVVGEDMGDRYFVRSVGDKVTADVIRKYIQYILGPLGPGGCSYRRNTRCGGLVVLFMRRKAS